MRGTGGDASAGCIEYRSDGDAAGAAGGRVGYTLRENAAPAALGEDSPGAVCAGVATVVLAGGLPGYPAGTPPTRGDDLWSAIVLVSWHALGKTRVTAVQTVSSRTRTPSSGPRTERTDGVRNKRYSTAQRGFGDFFSAKERLVLLLLLLLFAPLACCAYAQCPQIKHRRFVGPSAFARSRLGPLMMIRANAGPNGGEADPPHCDQPKGDSKVLGKALDCRRSMRVGYSYPLIGFAVLGSAGAPLAVSTGLLLNSTHRFEARVSEIP